MTKFTHLHVHSHYSLLDGLSRIKPLVKTAKALGFDALALTDSGVMYGAIEFYKVCREEGVKPIIGFEAFITNDLAKDAPVYPLIMLAENYNGYKNLIKLCSYGQTAGWSGLGPRIDKVTLRKYAKNIIALSGDIRGEAPSLLKQGKVAAAISAAQEYNQIFGENNFYLELQDHPAIEGQMEVNAKLLVLAKTTNLPLVVTRDAHYLAPEDSEAQDILLCIRDGRRVVETGREDFRQVDRSLNSAEDIISRFRHIPEAIENTNRIAERIEIKIELDQWHFAPVKLPDGQTADEVLRNMAFASVEKFMPLTPEIETRLNYELEIIKDKGYAPYFLCVADYVDYAKRNGIVETTRGSAAGSLVSYAIGITTVDPIRFKLPFERFLNPYRPSPPDVDTDFADNRRDEMINYVVNKYGQDKVAQIITFGTMAARASVRDVGRVLGFAYTFCDQVAKLIPFGSQGFAMTIERALREEPDLKKLYDSNADVKRLLDLARRVEGCARHTSIHAAGVVIAPTSLTDFTPIQYETGGERLVTQYEMKSVEAAGLLKNDFLGIRNLAILGNAVEFVEKTTGDKIDIYKLPLDDAETFAMLSRGETMGVFQLAGAGMTRWIKELKPTTIEDIMAMVALYRPGPMDFIPEYIRRKHHPETIDYPHPDTKEILEMSLGLLIYQDDIMLIAIKLAGYDWLEADKFRKAMGKKIPELMIEQENNFKQGCIKNNIPRNVVNDLWERIKPFASYGFNKAHAASYGIVAYQTAYMKAHYPVQYMTAILQAESGDADKVAAIVAECKRMDIEVLPPDVNESFRNFAMVSKSKERGRIRFGLSAIKNVGEHICEIIYRERKNNGAYKSLEDFLARINDKDLNKKSLESLIQAGALDCFGYDRGGLLGNIENLLFFIRNIKEKSTSNQDSLFSGTGISLDDKVVLKDFAPATMDEKLVWEKNLLGLYVSSHPFLHFDRELSGIITPLSLVEGYRRDKVLVVGGIISNLKKKITKKGSIMMFAMIEDVSGSMELLVFPKVYEATQSSWREGKILCVIAKTPREEGDNKLFVEKIYPLNKENLSEIKHIFEPSDYPEEKREAGEKAVVLRLTKEELKDNTDKLRDIFGRHAGEYQLFLAVGGETIRTKTKVNFDADFTQAVDALLGAGRLTH